MKKLTKKELDKMRCRIVNKRDKDTSRIQDICDKQMDKADREWDREMKRWEKLVEKFERSKP